MTPSVTTKNDTRLVGLIPAAGKGMRARPYTHEIHKGLFSINGVPNLQRIITLMRDDLAIRDIYIVTGYLGDSIKAHFGDGSDYAVNLRYLDNDKLDRGWAWSILLAKDHIDSHFCVMLCDECYINSNHENLRVTNYEQHLAICAGMRVDDVSLIRKNYGIGIAGDCVQSLTEKPEHILNDLMGSGTFILSPDVFPRLENAFAEAEFQLVDFVSFLNQQIAHGADVGFFELTGTYVNINDRDSLQLAKYHDRIKHFRNYKTSLLISSEGTEGNIAFTIDRYRELNLFDQIAVVLPADNAILSDLKNYQSSYNKLEIIVCPKSTSQFGSRLRHGMERLDGDIFILTEADYSFANRDVEKLLSYLKESDIVIGTRTTRQLIEQGSTMRGIVRGAHTALGKLLELLWWQREGRFTDVGCTFRALWKTTYQQLEPKLESNGPEFLADMVIEALNQHQRVLEIPVNYFNRSQSQNRIYRNAATFFRVFWFIIKRRIR
ncbi:MAG: glycosyltransferase [Halioglobus sp.]|nr:glycosyltransferase [Halioglobus sp.]